MNDKILLTLSDFTSRYSVSRTAIYREVKAERLRFTKVGRRSYISHADALKWMERLRVNEDGLPN